jgi:hypothetical protein
MFVTQNCVGAKVRFSAGSASLFGICNKHCKTSPFTPTVLSFVLRKQASYHVAVNDFGGNSDDICHSARVMDGTGAVAIDSP